MGGKAENIRQKKPAIGRRYKDFANDAPREIGLSSATRFPASLSPEPRKKPLHRERLFANC